MDKKRISVIHQVWPVLGLMLCLALPACSERQPDNHDHPSLKTGAELYDYHCAGCHGEDGTGMLESRTPANILTVRGLNGIVNYITTPINAQHRRMPIYINMSRAEAIAIAKHLMQLREGYWDTPANLKKPEELMIKP